MRATGLVAAWSPRPPWSCSTCSHVPCRQKSVSIPRCSSLPARQSRGLGAAPQHVTVWRQSGADGRVGTANMMRLLRLLVLRCSTTSLQLGSREGVNLSDLFFPLPFWFFFLPFDGVGCPCRHHPHCRILSKPGETSSGVVLAVQTMMRCPGRGPSSQGNAAAARTGWAQALLLQRWPPEERLPTPCQGATVGILTRRSGEDSWLCVQTQGQEGDPCTVCECCTSQRAPAVLPWAIHCTWQRLPRRFSL